MQEVIYSPTLFHLLLSIHFLSQAQLIAVDKDQSIILSGDGDVISEPMDGVTGEAHWAKISFRREISAVQQEGIHLLSCATVVALLFVLLFFRPAIGSGGLFALAAARALVDRPDLDARQVAVKVNWQWAIRAVGASRIWNSPHPSLTSLYFMKLNLIFLIPFF